MLSARSTETNRVLATSFCSRVKGQREESELLAAGSWAEEIWQEVFMALEGCYKY